MKEKNKNQSSFRVLGNPLNLNLNRNIDAAEGIQNKINIEKNNFVNLNILNWNCRGFNADKRNQLKIIENEFNPYIICLQETKFKNSYIPHINGYSCFFKNNNASIIACGGVMTLIKDNFAAKKINLVTNIQAVAVEVYAPVKFVICNIYANPNESITLEMLNDLIAELGNNVKIHKNDAKNKIKKKGKKKNGSLSY